jgi:N-acetylglucosaminyldiphosphoundecaprenol N-acetyl-beta-D-mannosaminyltransferase
VPRLCELSASKGYRIFFVGGASEASERAIARVKSQYPELTLAGHYSPPFADLLDMDFVAINTRIQEAKPHLLFVSFGTPKAEKWISMNYRKLNVPVTVSVGATLDFLAGTVARAPLWMQRSGTEWLFRILQEPRRLTRRYVKGFWVVGRALLWQWMALGSKPGKASKLRQMPLISESHGVQFLKLPERFEAHWIRQNGSLMERFLEEPHPFLVDAADVGFIDSTGVGWLMQLQKRAWRQCKTLILIAPNEAMNCALRSMRLLDFFPVVPDLASAQQFAQELRSGPVAKIHFESSRRKATLAWSGEITAANQAEVWSQTERHLIAWAAATCPMTIDLAGLRYMDTSGVILLNRARSFCEHRGTSVGMVGIQRNVMNTIALANCETITAAPRE